MVVYNELMAETKYPTKDQSNFVKLVAILLMVVDHVGAVFFPQLIVLRVIGRGAFFLFTYQIAISYDLTRNRKRFLLRLIFFAIVSQPIYYLIFSGLNIFFTLAFGVIAIYLTKKYGWWTILAIMILAQIFNFDFGFVGIGIIVLSYYFRTNLHKLILSEAALYIASCPVLLALKELNYLWLIEPLGFFSYYFVSRPVNLKWPINKWIFYGFYPVHLLLIALIYLRVK